MKLTDGSTQWWHCTSCGFELQREFRPSGCPLCKRREEFKKGQMPKKKDPNNTYDKIVEELEKYEDGCEPLTSKSGMAE